MDTHNFEINVTFKNEKLYRDCSFTTFTPKGQKKKQQLVMPDHQAIPVVQRNAQKIYEEMGSFAKRHNGKLVIMGTTLPRLMAAVVLQAVLCSFREIWTRDDEGNESRLYIRHY